MTTYIEDMIIQNLANFAASRSQAFVLIENVQNASYIRWFNIPMFGHFGSCEALKTTVAVLHLMRRMVNSWLFCTMRKRSRAQFPKIVIEQIRQQDCINPQRGLARRR